MDETGFISIGELILPRFDALASGNVDAASPVLVLLIWFVGLATLAYVWRWARQAHRWISEVETLLEGIDANNFWSYRSEISQRAQACGKPVAEAWRGFDATLVNTDDRLLSTAPAEVFFNEHRFAPRLVDNRILHAVPASLTTLGLLGTFLGLTVGLQALDLGSTTDELRVGIQTLVAGAALGFTASLWGVFASLVTNLYERRKEFLVGRSVRVLQARIDELSALHAPEQSLSEIAFHTNESNEALQVLHEKIGNVLQESVAQVGNQTSKAVSDAIHQSLAPIMSDLTAKAAEQSADVFKEISGLLTASFQEMGVSVAEKLQTSSDSLRSTIDYMGEQLARHSDEHRIRVRELEDSAAKAVQDLQEAATRQIERIHEATAAQTLALTETVDRQLALLDGSLPKIITGLDRSATLIGAATSGMDHVVTGLGSVTTELTAASTGMSTMLRDSIGAVEDLADATAEAAESVTAQQAASSQLAVRAVEAADQLKRASELLSGGYDGMRSSQDRFLQGFDQNLERYAKEMSGWLSEYSAQVSQQTTHRMDEWNGHTERFTSTMIGAAQALSDAVDELADRQAAPPAVNQS